MLTLLTIAHFIVCIFLIAIVLLQHGKGADAGASFGGGSGKTVFGTEGPLPLLSKITTASAIIFMFTSVTLAYYSANVSKSSVMKSLDTPAPVLKEIEVAPTPVEVPMTDAKQPTKTDDKAPAPAQFPGQEAPATKPATPAPPSDIKQPSQKPSDSQPKAPAPTPAPAKG